MKNLIITTIWLLSSIALFSQTEAIEFTYDAAGNRTERHVIELKALEKSIEQGAGGVELQSGDEVVYEDKLGDKEISIFPNPTRGELTVVIRQTTSRKAHPQDSGQTNARIELYTLAGELLQTSTLETETVIDLSAKESGTYVLKILLDDRVSTWKVGKQ